MSYLLDTHTLLWTLFEPKRLGSKAAACLKSPDVDVAVSVVSFWEISLKLATGKLQLVNATPDDFPDLTRRTGLAIIPLADTEAASFHRLPRLAHKDPFGRLLIWQAISRQLTLVSRDQSFAAYQEHGLKLIW